MAKSRRKSAAAASAAKSSRPSRKRAGGGGARAAQGEKRRQAILTAALEEFSARGFAAARLDDVARRANVAKGTIYLYFRDKETLFQELVRAELSPVVEALERAPMVDLPLGVVAERLVELFVREIFATRRKNVIRLVLTEGPRFPAIAEFYYREVISHVVGVLRTLAEHARERGELPNDSLVRFPQLLGAAGIVAIVWSGLFDRWAKLDAEAFMRAYFDLIFRKEQAP
ncbi:MAG TPA: TetR/AcrR family transcriptional regulator [Xanthobacteraceae bacterium]|nr:TetR/AcrR family transcriptional regulator [Xanthobacteraceae bacterium]